LAALDFEHVLKVTVEHLLGAYVNLDSWVGWDIIHENLGSTCESTRQVFEDFLKNYASKKMTTKILGQDGSQK